MQLAAYMSGTKEKKKESVLVYNWRSMRLAQRTLPRTTA